MPPLALPAQLATQATSVKIAPQATQEPTALTASMDTIRVAQSVSPATPSVPIVLPARIPPLVLAAIPAITLHHAPLAQLDTLLLWLTPLLALPVPKSVHFVTSVAMPRLALFATSDIQEILARVAPQGTKGQDAQPAVLDTILTLISAVLATSLATNAKHAEMLQLARSVQPVTKLQHALLACQATMHHL
jgi:hypothetical protein